MDPYLQRCLELARLPGAIVEPNPRVGAVVVHEDRIIGEGYHQQYGAPHAEVNAVRSVVERHLLPESTIYVSLEPCNHHGKTPPCTGLILENKIPRVVIGSLDPNPKMAGKSVDFLHSQGVTVEVSDDPAPFLQLNPHFWTNQLQYRAYITLKWAESADGFLAGFNPAGQPIPTPISPPFISRWVHQLRHQHQAILVGKNTVLIDDPQLNTRKWPGYSPVKIVFDPELELPAEARIFQGARTIVVNRKRNEDLGKLIYFAPVEEEAFDEMGMLMTELYGRLGIGSILVEGGAQVLQQFLDQGCWDQAWRNVGEEALGAGLPAPAVKMPWKSVANPLGQLFQLKNPALRLP